MTPRRIFARIRYELVSLLLECAIAVAVLTATMISAPMILILAAQMDRLTTTGDWRGFRFSEFLDVLRIDPSAILGELPIAGFFLALPATLILFPSALALCLLAGVFHRLNRREKVKFDNMRKSAMIRDIERKLKAR